MAILNIATTEILLVSLALIDALLFLYMLVPMG